MQLFYRFLFSCFLVLSVTAVASAESSSDSKKTPVTSAIVDDLAIQNIFSRSKEQVEAQADSVEYLRDQKKIIAQNNVTLRYEETVITADYGEVETETQKAYARGHVIIFRHGEPRAQGDEIYYDFKTGAGSFPDGRSVNMPWFTRGEQIDQVREGVKVVKNGIFTSCDLHEPHYSIHAKKITIHDGDKAVARNVKIYVLGKPILWLPILVMPLQNKQSPIGASAGYTSEYGAYISLYKGFSITQNMSGKVRVDWRSKRGVGGGIDIGYDNKTIGQSILNLYLTQDQEAPNIDKNTGALKGEEDRERGRISWRHRKDFDPDSHIQLRFNRISDEYFLQDFFENEHRAEIEPDTFITGTKNTSQFGLLAHIQTKINPFDRTVERLPLLQFDWRPQAFLKPWLFYENQASYTYMNKRFGRLDDFDLHTQRYDTWHQWSTPVQWRHFKFTPRIGVRGSYYTREKESDQDRFRMLSSYGTDLRTHFYRTFPVSFSKAGIEINQLRHVIEPNIQYDIMQSSVSDEKLQYFDRIDRLDDSQVVTFGVENRIQTKRVVNGQMRRVDLISLNTFLSYEMYPDGRTQRSLFAPYETGYTSSNFSVLGQEIVLRPYEWLLYELRTDYDVRGTDFQVLTQDVTLRYRRFRVTMGHRYTHELSNTAERNLATTPEINETVGRNLFVFDTNYTINKLWDIGGYIRWDGATQDLEEWQVSAKRDLHDFLLDFGYNARNSRTTENEKMLYFDFRLKAFPDIGFNGGSSRASFGTPRIGETVAGANQYYSFESSQSGTTYEKILPTTT